MKKPEDATNIYIKKTAKVDFDQLYLRHQNFFEERIKVHLFFEWMIRVCNSKLDELQTRKAAMIANGTWYQLEQENIDHAE